LVRERFWMVLWLDFEWYFDPKCCIFVGFQDYQRLVLREDVRNFTPCNYVSVHLSCTNVFCGHNHFNLGCRAFGRVVSCRLRLLD
jgi:hypothetical protein